MLTQSEYKKSYSNYASQPPKIDKIFALELEDVMAKYPTLTIDGFEETTAVGFDTRRKQLAESVEAYYYSLQWLGKHKRTETVNKKVGGTYLQKHAVERWLRDIEGINLYIPEGAYIAAALFRNMKTQRIENSRSVFLNISSRTPTMFRTI